ncbi:class I SAM-dependent methyltransferase [Salegentibacter chungangensis]|uniref:Class I SAM-dependent methyltransferase n=1 Tax=Salegentibacter chungangensis TaxID=1335724 RepID=A0ABW3NT75_9FLAO
MSISKAYNSWAGSYDEMKNKTRDLEARVIRKKLANNVASNILELGSGTGKNSFWLADKAENFKGLDFSEEMMARARNKIKDEHMEFLRADLNTSWPVADAWANLITCSLVLEHIENLDFIFREAKRVLDENGKIYLCELHPFKQYKGSKARFETKDGTQELEVYVHHISEYLEAAKRQGLKLVELDEHFDDKTKDEIPRLISLIFRK